MNYSYMHDIVHSACNELKDSLSMRRTIYICMYITRDTYTQCRTSCSEFLRLSVSIPVAVIMHIAFHGCLGVSFGKPPRREDLDKAGQDHGDGRSHAGSLQ